MNMNMNMNMNYCSMQRDETGSPEQLKWFFDKTLDSLHPLMIILPQDTRARCKKWIHTFKQMNKEIPEMKIRNDYMWFLLVQAENRSFIYPFTDDPPPSGPLPPLADSVEFDVYLDILLTAHQAGLAAEQEKIETEQAMMTYKDSRVQYQRPTKFLDSQPSPLVGIMCYGSVFSRQK